MFRPDLMGSRMNGETTDAASAIIFSFGSGTNALQTTNQTRHEQKKRAAKV